MDSVSAANAASTTARAASSTSRTSTTSTSKTADGKDFATLFADAKKDLKRGETLSKVDGHDYARIKGGTRDDQCVNLSGNTRSGQAFDLIWRDGRQFHVYGGRGADHKVVEVGHKAATTTTGGTDSTTGATSTGTRSSTGTTDASASTGTASTSGTASTGSNAADVTSSYTAGTTGTSDTSSSTR